MLADAAAMPPPAAVPAAAPAATVEAAVEMAPDAALAAVAAAAPGASNDAGAGEPEVEEAEVVEECAICREELHPDDCWLDDHPRNAGEGAATWRSTKAYPGTAYRIVKSTCTVKKKIYIF